MLIVTGSLVAHAEHVVDLLELSQQHVERSRREPGCLEHGVYRDAENPLRLVFFERWTDRAALAAHFALPSSRAFVQKASKLVSQAPELRVFSAEPVEI